MRIETVTVRCEGAIGDVRLLHRRLQAEGMTVQFGTHGMLASDAMLESGDRRRWFQLVVTGHDSETVCGTVIAHWSDGGRVWIV